MIKPVSSGRSGASISAVANPWVSLVALSLMLAWGPSAHAEPWAAPGDLALRDDLQLLADLGVLRVPLTSWPVPWAQIAEATLETPLDITLRPYEQAVLARVQRRVREATRSGAVRTLRVSAQELPRRVRTFEYSPREEGELQGGWSWLGNRFAANLTTTAVTSAEDDQTVRFDGSYGAVVLGNWMLSVGQFDRWWGPGWNGSLIFSSNARPVPAISLDRNYSEPFDLPILRKFGPWTLNFFFGQQEEDRPISNPLLLGFRTAFKPTPYLEIGISRAAQTCGEGRRCNFDSFVELLVGNDNRVGELTLDQEPGNQLAGVDFRFSMARYKLPIALYGQLIGDDEANGLPSRFVGLAGAEWWGHVGRQSLRTYLEVADTQTGVLDSRLPDFAYSSAVFPGGFRFNGRTHGHSADGDSFVGTFGAILQGERDQRWMALVQGGELNRVGNRVTPVAADATDYFNAELSHQRRLANGTLHISVGYEHFAPTGAPSESGVKGFVQWTWKR